MILNGTQKGKKISVASPVESPESSQSPVLADATPVGTPVYIISSMNATDALARGHIAVGEVLDEASISALRLGSAAKPKELTIRIRSLGGGRYEVRAMSDYGMMS